jgi:hypothetical protein
MCINNLKININNLQLAVAAGHQESKEDREKPLVIWHAKKHKNLLISPLAIRVPSGKHNEFIFQILIRSKKLFYCSLTALENTIYMTIKLQMNVDGI